MRVVSLIFTMGNMAANAFSQEYSGLVSEFPPKKNAISFLIFYSSHKDFYTMSSRGKKCPCQISFPRVLRLKESLRHILRFLKISSSYKLSLSGREWVGSRGGQIFGEPGLIDFRLSAAGCQEEKKNSSWATKKVSCHRLCRARVHLSRGAHQNFIKEAVSESDYWSAAHTHPYTLLRICFVCVRALRPYLSKGAKRQAMYLHFSPADRTNVPAETANFALRLQADHGAWNVKNSREFFAASRRSASGDPIIPCHTPFVFNWRARNGARFLLNQPNGQPLHFYYHSQS